MCISNLSNAVNSRQFRITRVKHLNKGTFPSDTTFYLQMKFNHKDVWVTVKAFCSTNPEVAKEQAEQLLSLLNKSGITKEEPISLPDTVSYKEMKKFITVNKLPIKKNIPFKDMKEAINTALKGM